LLRCLDDPLSTFVFMNTHWSAEHEPRGEVVREWEMGLAAGGLVPPLRLPPS